MHEHCDCPDGDYCEKYGLAVHPLHHRWIRGKSGLSEEKEQFYIGLLLSGKLKAPSLFRKAANLATAVVEHVRDGGKEVADEVYQNRLAACSSCPLLDSSSRTCVHQNCGCKVDIKARWASERCPEGKWEREGGERGCRCGASSG